MIPKKYHAICPVCCAYSYFAPVVVLWSWLCPDSTDPIWRTRLHKKPRRAAVQRMLAGQRGRLLCHTLSYILFTTSDKSKGHVKILNRTVEHFENLTSLQSTIEMHGAIVQF